MRRGRLVLGVSCASAYGELAWAEEGGGAFLEGEPISVSSIAEVGSAILSTGNLKTLAASAHGWRRFGDLVGRVNRLRGYGDFLHYHLLARGALDVVLESDVNILDIAALSVIVREAGGTMTELNGGPIQLTSTTVLASNGALHTAVLEALR
jgi:histidinol-phosphatase